MQTTEPDLDIYELAYLAGGSVHFKNAYINIDRVLEVAIINLIEKKVLQWDTENKVLVKLETNNHILGEIHSLLTDRELRLFDNMPQNCTMGNLRYGWIPRLRVNDIPDRLESYGLFYIDRQKVVL